MNIIFDLKSSLFSSDVKEINSFGGAPESTVGSGLGLSLSPEPCGTYREANISIQLPVKNCTFILMTNPLLRQGLPEKKSSILS